jgi:hypothetical protein
MTLRRLCTLSHGDSGKGKTYFVGTICEKGKPFIIDTERGLLTIENLEGQYDHTTVHNYTEFATACDYYFENAKEKGYTHLVIDSVTRLQKLLIDQILKVPESTTLSALSLKPKTLSIREWGEVNSTMNSVIDNICSRCPTSVHMTALSGESTDKVSGITKVWPLIQGGFRFSFPGYFDMVLYHDSTMTNGKVTYHIQTEGCNRNIAKNRLSHVKKLRALEPNSYEVISNILKEL